MVEFQLEQKVYFILLTLFSIIIVLVFRITHVKAKGRGRGT